MENRQYLAMEAAQLPGGEYQLSAVQKAIPAVPADGLLIRVIYSSVNYKDALSATGNKAVTRSYPHVPGIDAAGIVEVSDSVNFSAGDEVIVTGFDLGMNTDGGYAEYITVPAGWAIKKPAGMTLRESMIYGTAGFTAGLSVEAILKKGIQPQDGNIAVSGATGGVGSVAVAILSRLGFKVTAISGKASAADFLRDIGADELVAVKELDDQSGKPLLKPRFAAAVDTVGGNILATLLKSTGYGGIVTACGLVAGADIHTTVFPFILKSISLAGIDSVELPLAYRHAVWEKLADEWKPEGLDKLVSEISLKELPQMLDMIRAGQMRGRAIVKI